MAKFASEVEMMRPLVDHFRGTAREMRENLPVVLRGERVAPDLVVVRETGDLEVFEGKLHLTDEVIAQAKRWRQFCHRSYVVVPEPEGADTHHRLRRKLIANMNLGLIYIRHHDSKPEFQHQFNLYLNPKPNVDFLLAAMDQAPPASTDKPAGAPSVQPSRALRNFGDVIRYIEANGPTSLALLIKAGALKYRERMRLVRAIEQGDLPALEYTGVRGDVQLATSEATT